jgi:hypothetical protein
LEEFGKFRQNGGKEIKTVKKTTKKAPHKNSQGKYLSGSGFRPDTVFD